MDSTLAGGPCSTVNAVDFGLAIFPTEDGPEIGAFAKLVEDVGYESLFFPEHTHIPAARQTPWPGGGELPPMYSRTYDPFVALTVAAVATESLKIGTGVCLVIERDPIITAKEVASVDQFSNGRFLFGVGAGWNEEEMRDHGTDPSRRFGVMRERIEAMKAIWTEDEASYEGKHVSFERIWSWPKPVQKPHPPVLVGGSGPRVLDRVLSFGDAWMPNRLSDEELEARIAELNRRAEELGRPPVPVTVAGVRPDAGQIARLERAGVHRVFFWLPPARTDVGPAIEACTAAIEEYRRG
jgi:probable F420-dependent oxidoreductase